jgi:hypothetical protein
VKPLLIAAALSFAPAAHADISKDLPSVSASKLPRDWQPGVSLGAADKEAPSPSKSAPARLPAPKRK